MQKHKTIGQAIIEMGKRDSQKPAVKYRQDNHWQSLSWQQYLSEVESLGAGLLKLGIEPDDKVGLMSNTRFEWGVCDLAILGCHGVTIPIYQNNVPDDIVYIINNSGAKIFFFENHYLFKIWNDIKEKCLSVKWAVSIEPIETLGSAAEADPSIIDFQSLKKTGSELLGKEPLCFQRKCESLLPTDIATIVYTSGTTGVPKGAVLTHTQIMSEVSEVIPICGVTHEDTSLCFLPLAHVMGRVEHWAHVEIGFTLAYAESIERIRPNLLEIKPTFIVAVPRIFEKIYTSILGQVSTPGLRSNLFKWAVQVGKRVSEFKQTRQTIPVDLLTQYIAAKKLVLNKVTDAFGGNIRFAISGGAPLSKEISSFFHGAGILVLEGYGLTETTAAIAVNTPFLYQFGTVGKPVGDVKIKLDDDGEILIRSDKVMKEYYNNPEATAEVFTADGWFRSGDIGEFTESGCLRITDRKKDLIKTAGGKYIAPQRIENLLKLNPIIGNVLIHGDEKKYIVALVTVDRQYVENWAKQNKVPYKKWQELTLKAAVVDLVRKAITDTNRQLASWETIKKYLILPQEFTIEGGELTPSMKVKRKALDKKFVHEIQSLYS